MDSRWRIREKSYRTGGITSRKPIVASDLKLSACCDVPTVHRRVHDQGFGKGLNVPTTALGSQYGNNFMRGENCLALEFRQSSSKEANGIALEVQMDEEVLKEKEIRHPSPCVIAKLMGLDTLPPRKVANRQQRETRSIIHKTPSTGFREKHISRENHLSGAKTEDYQEFKDVFEVMETRKGEMHRKPVRKGMQSSKATETDMAFVRQNFMDGKRLPNDLALQNSKLEVNDAMEVTDSKKDLFFKFMEEPNSLFSKHLQDLNYVLPARAASDITVLRSSKGGKRDITEVRFSSERKAVPKDFIRSWEKPATSLVNYSLKEHSYSVSQRLSKPHHGEAFESYLDLTEIVLLKPSLEKVDDTKRAIVLPRFPDNFQFGFRRYKASRRSRIQELYAERKDREKFDHVEIIGNSSKSSRETAREITEQMGYSCNTDTGVVYSSKLGSNRRDEILYTVTGTSNLSDSKAFQRGFDDLDDWHSRSRPSTSYSSESSVSREARKRLSQRWKMTNRTEGVGLVARGSATLAEMFAHSDREVPKNAPSSLHIQKASIEKLAREAVLARCKDVREDGRFINPRPLALSSSSTVHQCPKASCKQEACSDDYGCRFSCMSNDVLNLGPDNSLDGITLRGTFLHRKSKRETSRPRLFSSDGLENMPSVGTINISPVDYTDKIDAILMAEEKPMIREISNDAVTHTEKLSENSATHEFKDVSLPVLSNEDQVHETAVAMVAKDGECHSDETNTVVEESSFAHPRVEILQSNCDGTKPDPVIFKELEQRSPISVLKSPSEEENCGLEGFERLSFDLQELRMQLQLLKLESEDTDAEESEVLVSSEEDMEGGERPLKPMEEMLQAFRDEEDRDFSYLLDIVICSGVHSTNQDKIFDSYYSPENPVSPGVFEKLEKRYRSLVAWPLSERKLLFDLINSILAEILAPHMDLHPWVVKSKARFSCKFAREGLVEEVWQTVVRLRKEMGKGNPESKIMDLRWLDLGNDIDMTGKEIEQMLMEEILEEFMSDFIVG